MTLGKSLSISRIMVDKTMLLEGVHIPLSGARECTTLPGTSNFASGIKLRNLTWAIILDDPNSLSVITRALRGKEGDRRVRVREGT